MATFCFFAPSGYLADPHVLDRAEALLIGLGHDVKRDRSLLDTHYRFAGDVATRIAAFERVAADPDVDVAVAARGGYGITQLLDALDFGALAGSGKLWLGHSDFTAFSLAMLAAGGQNSLQGPMVAADLGAETPSDFTLAHFTDLLASGRDAIVVSTPQAWQGSLDGVLWGGNLSMVNHLLGTPWWPQVEGGILFLEDVCEAPFRVERLLYQLLHAGVLARQKAILLGDFSGYRLGQPDNGYDFDAMLAHLRSRITTPILTGLPFGHVPDKLTLPVGGHASLVSTAEGWRLDIRATAPAPHFEISPYTVRAADWGREQAMLRAVRYPVFVVEQNVPEEIEWDAMDAACLHALAVDTQGRPVGTARLLPDGHIGRVAVLPAWRGKGVGRRLMRWIIAMARSRGHLAVELNAQTSAAGFYAGMGFETCGPEFVEAGILHVPMRLAF
ncbi:GNAT family N-acetyltransferase [Niveibacterium sp. 24ML]|uniref:GNAT family N-acetyltransferase n=1 Tax=Niveibacterium sp. 24ML TaxID=2985512 RepID=UPI00226DC2F8|nr:GNAT family N-acetyltransferase [Niveibacterium sp. 24ML]MCX9156727.1 GNAT family N-acetyltransferase [Niveibacterium sp. 24ML]